MLIVNTIRGSVREYSYRLVSYAEILLKFISSDLGVRPFSAKRTQGKAGMCRDETYAFVSHPGSAARFLVGSQTSWFYPSETRLSSISSSM